MSDPLDDLVAHLVRAPDRIPPRGGPLAPVQLRLFANVLEAWLDVESAAASALQPTIVEVLEETIAELRRAYEVAALDPHRTVQRPPYLDPNDAAILLLAIAELSLRRPGWYAMLLEVAERLGSRATFEQFRRTSSDRVGPEAGR